MRYTFIKGKQDGINITMDGRSLLFEVTVRTGKRTNDPLEYVCEMTGEQIHKALLEHEEEEFGSRIVNENTYIVTAYDW